MKAGYVGLDGGALNVEQSAELGEERVLERTLGALEQLREGR